MSNEAADRSRFVSIIFLSIALACCLCALVACAAPIANYQVSGCIIDAITQAPIAGVQVSDGQYAPDLNASGTTDADGRFSYMTYPEEHTLVIAKAGYVTKTITMVTTAGSDSSTINQSLEPSKQ